MNCKQVKFMDEGKCFGGIMIDGKYIICGECGSVFNVDEVDNITSLTWIDISEAIIGDDYDE